VTWAVEFWSRYDLATKPTVLWEGENMGEAQAFVIEHQRLHDPYRGPDRGRSLYNITERGKKHMRYRVTDGCRTVFFEQLAAAEEYIETMQVFEHDVDMPQRAWHIDAMNVWEEESPALRPTAWERVLDPEV
jgi:hypothetical protein